MKTFLCDKKYLIFPVSYYAQNKHLILKDDDKTVLDLVIPLDYINTDFLTYVNVERFNGKTLNVTVNPEMHLEIKKSDIKYENETFYKEPLRPFFHFTAKKGWLNDPNGMVNYQGVTHLFFQHNPVSRTWGNMHWGHAVSRDLLHWEEQECAIYPNEMGTAFSGSAIVDYKNVSRLKQNENSPIVLFYTSAPENQTNFTQCIAYSIDGGKTFIDYEKNPVIENITGGNRDPKVQYHKESDQYVMVLYLEKNRFAFFTSKNLLNWEKINEFNLDNDNECPDFYPLPLDGNKTNIKWVFSAAKDHYIIGDFDGNKFTPCIENTRLHFGKNSYAAQSWYDEQTGRRLRIAWNTFETPHTYFNNQMTFPCEMSLKSQGNEPKLCINPVKEIESLYTETVKKTNIDSYIQELSKCGYDITVKFECITNTAFVRFFGAEITLTKKELSFQDCKAPLVQNKDIIVRILIDCTGAEIFVNDGSAFISNGYIMDYNLNKLEITGEFIKEISVNKIKGIWEVG